MRRRIVEAARRRLSDFQGTDDLRGNLAAWGRTAAEAVGDAEAAEFFQTFLGDPARTRLF